MNTAPQPNARQSFFTEIVLGALIYSVVFGFFADYTDILYTSSYSTTFMAAILMQLLIYPTFQLKKRTAGWFKKRTGTRYKIGLVLSVWAIMFSSKFVFLAALNVAFGANIEIKGFVGLLVIILCATLLTKLTQLVYTKLGRM